LPIYEYHCAGCGGRWEVLQRRPSDAPEACPNCGQARFAKVPSAPSMVRASAGAGTCCGREERCDSPPCGSGACHSH
jgi:putative FmdB family regulatory protein